MTNTDDIIFMDARITPNNSLSPRGFTVVMSIVAIGSFLGGLLFVSMGAWPVMGFFGLDAFAIWYAFKLSRRRQKAETHVIVTSRELKLHHTDEKGDVTLAEVPVAFARVELDEPVRVTDWLRIEYGRKAYVIGKFLTPSERKSLADALRMAVRRASSHRYVGENEGN